MHHHPIYVNIVCDGQAYGCEHQGDRDLEDHQDEWEDEVEEVDRDTTPALPISVHVGVLKVDWLEHKGLKDLEKGSHYSYKG